MINTGTSSATGGIQTGRFLKINQALTASAVPPSQQPRRTDTETDKLARAPAGGRRGRLRYCFDSADGWVRFIAPINRWPIRPLLDTRGAGQYSDEEIR